MARPIYLFLKSNNVPINGESEVTSMDRADAIECFYYESGISSDRNGGSASAVGKHVKTNIVIRKRLDKATGLLSKALCTDEKIDGVFKFYRTKRGGDGKVEMFFTIEMKDARIATQEILIANASSDATGHPPMEMLTFATPWIEWKFVDGGVGHIDDFRTSD